MPTALVNPPPITCPTAAIRLDGVSQIHGRAGAAVTALRDVNVAFERDSFTAVMGPSGSGKSTFLRVAAGLERPTSGYVHLGDLNLTGMRARKLAALRRRHIGFVPPLPRPAWRAAIDQALAAPPHVLFVDEPAAGDLDVDTVQLLRAYVDRRSLTVVMASQGPAVTSYADAVLYLAGGQIVDYLIAPSRTCSPAR